MPTLAYRLATDEGLSWVPLQGMIIGNGFSDPLHMLEYGNFLEGVGLVNREQADEIRQQTKVSGDRFTFNRKVTLEFPNHP